MNRKELVGYMEYLITVSAKEQWKYLIKLFKIYWPRERLQKGKYNLEESYNDFLIY